MSRFIALAAIAILLLVSISGLASFGLIGPDEPRYASVGREMAISGDWVTPRLWGAPWFEKPALLYWLIGAGFRLGLGSELAPRIGVALIAILFILFLFWWARREFNLFVGAVAAGLLATSSMWIAFSHAAVADIPLAASFAGAMLLFLPAVEGRAIPARTAAALLGLSVLSKGLVPLVLALPFLWFGRHHWRLWFRPAPVFVFAAVTIPWYLLCTMQNGPIFLQVFFWQHQLGRFTSDALQHVQPVWFYVPWVLGALFPSVLLAAFALLPRLYRDRRRRALLLSAGFGLLFFSVSRNKLAGYILPLLPFVCLLAASGVDVARRLYPRTLSQVNAASLLLLPLFILAGSLLPKALGGGLRDAFPVEPATAGKVAGVVPIAIVAAIASLLLTRERALILWFALISLGWLYIEYAALPWVDASSSARAVWRALPEPKRDFCVGPVTRAWRYGLNYYAMQPLPDCPPAIRPPRRAIMPADVPAARPVIY